MKLGTQTASVTNWMMSGTKGQPAPKVGMGVTLLMWTDRHAGTIVRVTPSGKTLWFVRDIAVRLDDNGMSESQQYNFVPGNPANEEKATLRKDGSWKCATGTLRIGSRDEYHDYSF